MTSSMDGVIQSPIYIDGRLIELSSSGLLRIFESVTRRNMPAFVSESDDFQSAPEPTWICREHRKHPKGNLNILLENDGPVFTVLPSCKASHRLPYASAYHTVTS